MTYTELNSIMVGRTKDIRKMGNNTYAIRNEDHSIGIRLHNTQVVVFFSDGSFKINSGGWRTVTTKARMNEFMPNQWGIMQKDFEWFIVNGITGEKINYSDNMILSGN